MSWFKHLTEIFKKKDLVDKIPVLTSNPTLISAKKSKEKKSQDPIEKLSDVPTVSEVSTHTQNRKHMDEQQRELILQQLGMMRSIREIKLWASQELGLIVSEAAIYQLRRNPKYLARQARYRSEYCQTINEIPLSSKVRRLEELNEMYDETKFIKQENLRLKEQMALRGERREILSQAQDEVEGKGSKFITQSLSFNQFNNMSQEERIKYKRDLLEELQTLRQKEIPDASQVRSATSSDGDSRTSSKSIVLEK